MEDVLLNTRYHDNQTPDKLEYQHQNILHYLDIHILDLEDNLDTLVDNLDISLTMISPIFLVLVILLSIYSQYVSF